MEWAIHQRGLDDLVLLDAIDEEHVCAILKQRFLSDGQMYTYAGPALVAINPYKVLMRGSKSIYDESVMDSYRGMVQHEVAPSVFAIAEAAYSSMLRYRRPSGIIISGESGAGKTESARQVLAYLARVSGAHLSAAHRKGGHGAPSQLDATIAVAQRVRDRLVTSTVVTEAFGNAATTRNDNSSRFGKLMTCNFRGSGIAAGGDVKVYLLEKSRVIAQGPGERNFHLFYQMLAGAGADIKRACRIESGPEGFAYLSHEYRKIPGVNDAAQWKALTACMNILGIPAERQAEMWRALAVVLHLGNIEITDGEDRDGSDDDSEGERHHHDAAAGAGGAGGPKSSHGARTALNAHAASLVRDGTSGKAVEAVASLLGVTADDVEQSLVKRTITVGGEETATLQSKAQALVARDSLAKALYEALFRMAVAEINKSIKTTSSVDAPATAAAPAAAAGAAAGAAAAAGKEKASSAKAAAKASPAKASPAKAAAKDSPAKASPAKASPAKASPAKVSPAKASPAKASPAKASPAKAGAAAAAGGAGHSSPGHPAASDTAAPGAADAAADAEDEPDPAAALAAAEARAEEERALALHVLDIYGFESLARNGFEQLCINYVNERLQGIFLDATLRSEQDEYAAEGIEWTPIEYFDNIIVVKLMDGKSGLYQLLDDACAMADASGEKIINAFTKTHGKHEHFSTPKIHDGTFTVRHYAGDVTYVSDDMGAANRDTITLDIARIVARSKGLPSLVGALEGRREAAEANKRPPTAGAQFRASVNALVEVLTSCQPHYIRCIKPNDQKKALTVDDERLAHQVRYLGLVEATRVKRAGFAYRAPYEEFLRRYRMLSKTTWPPQSVGDEEGVRTLLASVWMWNKPKDASALGVGVAMIKTGAGAGRGGPAARGGRGGAAASGAGRGAGFLLGRRAGPTGAAGGAGAAGAAAGGATGGAGGAAPGPAKPNLLGLGMGPGASAADSAAAAAAAPAGAIVAGAPGGPPAQVWTGTALPGDIPVAGSRQLRDGVDFQMGATKIFLKEPSTLFNLEYMRVKALGRVVSRVAALWRAHIGKRWYAKIKEAWRRQVANVRAHQARQRFLKMKAAAVRAQAAVRGFLVRCSPTATAMREALGLIAFYGKPRRRMSLNWEPPRKGDWLGLLMPGTTTPSPFAANVFAALARLRPPQAPDSLAYADTVLKVKQNYTVLRRHLVVTSDYVCNFSDPWQKGRINRAIPIAALERVSLSPLRDGYVVLHVAGQYDFVALAETKVSLVRALVEKHRALTGAELPVSVTMELAYRAYKKDPAERLRRLTFRPVSDLTVFESRPMAPWESKLLTGGGTGPGSLTGGRASLVEAGSSLSYAVDADASAAAEAAGAGAGAGGGSGTGVITSTVTRAYLKAEKQRAFHEVGGDKASLVVSVPVPPKVKLAELLTEKERDALKAKGVRCLA